jgi:hypothetical protein
MALLFLSYRAATAAPHAGRLYDRLAARFGEAAIFYDRGGLRPGDLWRERLREELERAVAVLPVIDPAWSASLVKEPDGEDMVRYELETAIHLQKTIVPLRVGGAAMPAPQEVPATLRSIVDRQFLVIDETTTAAYDASVAALIGTLDNIEGLLAAVETEAVELLLAKNYVAAERLLMRQTETARQRGSLSLYLALARLSGRSFNDLYPAERETIEMLLRRAWSASPAWELPLLLLAILRIDYYQLHGLAGGEPVRPAEGLYAALDARSRSLLSHLNISRRARRELQIDAPLP